MHLTFNAGVRDIHLEKFHKSVIKLKNPIYLFVHHTKRSPRNQYQKEIFDHSDEFYWNQKFCVFFFFCLAARKPVKLFSTLHITVINFRFSCLSYFHFYFHFPNLTLFYLSYMYFKFLLYFYYFCYSYL